MAKGKQLLYDEPEEEQYIVVTDPFRMPRSNRTQRHIEETAAWLRRVFKSDEAVHSILLMGTRAEIIVAISPEVDVTPSLGGHRWGSFMPHLNPAEAERISCIFKYNYRLRGDPLLHQWNAEWPERRVELRIVSPYPKPT
ncbi:hypothetical protein NEOLEDRAFT_1139981, partial [Neolentinus lepideus HHB14362 ss-1]